MAGSTGLTPRRAPVARLLVLAAGVLLAHALGLGWLAQRLAEPAPLKPLATPLFTRLLTPEAPPALPQAQAPPAVPQPPPRRVRTIRSTPAAATPTLAGPTPDADAAAPAAATSEAAAPTTDASAPPSPAVDAVAATEPAPAASAAEAAPAARPDMTGAGPATTADGWPADTRLNYRLSGRFRSGELYGSARVQWQRESSRYQTRVDVDLTLLASLVMTSQGEIGANGLLPEVYEELRRGRSRVARIGPTDIVLGDGRSVPRPPGVQDTASQFVELSHRFATGRDALEVGRSISIWLARPGAVDLWTYDIVERELLRTPQLGEVEAFRLTPRPIANPRGNITAEMWFAPSLKYLPVRIRVSMGDEAQIDLLVDTIEQR